MKKSCPSLALLLAFVSIASILNSFAGTLYPVVVGDRWGFVDKTGTLAINPQFDRAEAFSSGLAAFRLGGVWGYVDATGKIVINPMFESAAPFANGLAVVELGGRYGFVNQDG